MPQPEADGRACGACAGVWTTGVAGAGRATGLAAAAGLAERGTPQPLRLRPSRAGPVAAGGRLAGAFELGPKGLGAATRGAWAATAGAGAGRAATGVEGAPSSSCGSWSRGFSEPACGPNAYAMKNTPELFSCPQKGEPP